MPSGSAGRQVRTSITARGDERILGGTGLSLEAPYRAATGYVLARDSWGHGFATEALRAMVALAEHLGLARVHAFCHPQHAASRRVLEKCGFLCEGTWRRYPIPELLARWSGRCALLCDMSGRSACGVRSTQAAPRRAD